tara:strand:- start:252 stop:440 length:189 start_codon:yes stop_codon:yes gene_type:complete
LSIDSVTARIKPTNDIFFKNSLKGGLLTYKTALIIINNAKNQDSIFPNLQTFDFGTSDIPIG